MENLLGSVWGLFWSLFWITAFVAYLFALFAVIVDIFRDHQLGGWLKALWLILLFFVPYLTLLVYVIVRGQGMAARNYSRRGPVPDPEGEYVTGRPSANPSADIERAKKLLDEGTINAGEFDAIKAHALGSKY